MTNTENLDTNGAVEMAKDDATKAQRSRQKMLVVLVVRDAEGNIIPGLSHKNVEILSVEKKITIDLHEKILATPGAFFMSV